jgi:hypothetical protein
VGAAVPLEPDVGVADEFGHLSARRDHERPGPEDGGKDDHRNHNLEQSHRASPAERVLHLMTRLPLGTPDKRA